MGRRKKREYLSFELTPLIDIVFLLLIFFMVSSIFKTDELALLLKLPKSKHVKVVSKKVTKNINIEVKKEQVAINGKKTSWDGLDKELAKLAKKSQISLRADKKVRYELVVKVLDLLQKYKLENLSLITDRIK